MPYLNLDVNYFDHIKTVRLESILGRGAAELPIRLWAYCGKHPSTNGVLSGYTIKEVEKIIGWWGKEGEAVRALQRIGFLEREKSVKNVWKVHDWKDHEGHLKSFHERAKTAAARRWGTVLEDDSSNATSNAKDDPKQCSIPSLPSLPNLPNQTININGSAAPLGTAAMIELQAVGYQIPDPNVDPEKVLACVYREIRRMPKKDWAVWDERNLESFRPLFRELLQTCGTIPRACMCMRDKARDFVDAKYKNWTIRGIVKNATAWAENHPEVEPVARKPISSEPGPEAEEMTVEEMAEIRRKNLPGSRAPAATPKPVENYVPPSAAKSEHERKTIALRNKQSAAKALERIGNLLVIQSESDAEHPPKPEVDEEVPKVSGTDGPKAKES